MSTPSKTPTNQLLLQIRMLLFRHTYNLSFPFLLILFWNLLGAATLPMLYNSKLDFLFKPSTDNPYTFLFQCLIVILRASVSCLKLCPFVKVDWEIFFNFWLYFDLSRGLCLWIQLLTYQVLIRAYLLMDPWCTWCMQQGAEDVSLRPPTIFQQPY